MRKYIILVFALVVLMSVAVPAAADHADPIEGLWVATDTEDGSLMLMTVREQNNDTGYLNVVFLDLLATVACDPPAPYLARSTTSLYDDGGGGAEGRFFHLNAGRCLGRSSRNRCLRPLRSDHSVRRRRQHPRCWRSRD